MGVSAGTITLTPFARPVDVVEQALQAMALKNNQGDLLPTELRDLGDALSIQAQAAAPAATAQDRAALESFVALGSTQSGRFQRVIKLFMVQNMGFQRETPENQAILDAIGPLSAEQQQALTSFMTSVVGRE